MKKINILPYKRELSYLDYRYINSIKMDGYSLVPPQVLPRQVVECEFFEYSAIEDFITMWFEYKKHGFSDPQNNQREIVLDMIKQEMSFKS